MTFSSKTPCNEHTITNHWRLKTGKREKEMREREKDCKKKMEQLL